MRFVGAENKNINSITMVHKSNELKFRCLVEPLPFDSNSIQELDLPKDMTIVFNDIYEIDSLIDMLQRMKKECISRFGHWG